MAVDAKLTVDTPLRWIMIWTRFQIVVLVVSCIWRLLGKT